MTETKTWKQRWQQFVRQDAKPILITAFILFAFRSAIADWNDVPSGSMEPSIMIGDRVFVNKLAYDLKVPFTTWRVAQWDNPKRGDVVIFFSPADEQRLVKRVIGLPGDRIELRNDQLLVNDRAVTYETLSPKFTSEVSARRTSPASIRLRKSCRPSAPGHGHAQPPRPAQFRSHHGS